MVKDALDEVGKEGKKRLGFIKIVQGAVRMNASGTSAAVPHRIYMLYTSYVTRPGASIALTV